MAALFDEFCTFNVYFVIFWIFSETPGPILKIFSVLFLSHQDLSNNVYFDYFCIQLCILSHFWWKKLWKFSILRLFGFFSANWNPIYKISSQLFFSYHNNSQKNIRHLPLVNWFFGKWVKIDLFCAILWNFNFHNFCPTSCRIWKIFWKKGSVPLTVLMMYHSAILL